MPRTISQSPSRMVLRKKPRRWACQVYSILAWRSCARMSAILFSKPSRRSLVKGRLLGSAAMWRVIGSSANVGKENASINARTSALSNLKLVGNWPPANLEIGDTADLEVCDPLKREDI